MHEFKKVSKPKTNIAPLIILFLFLWPSLVQLSHHHEFSLEIYEVPQLHQVFEKCAVCNFEFSVFSNHQANFNVENKPYLAAHKVVFEPFALFSNLKYSFLLRAPPYLHS